MRSPAHRSTGAMSTAKRRPVRRPIRVQTYGVLARAVEEGVAYGLQRYFKYYTGEEGQVDIDIAEHIEREVLNALCGVIQFDGDV